MARDPSEYFDDDDKDEDFDEQEEIYDGEGNVVWSQYYEGQFVDRTCEGCGSDFRGMPDHGFCSSCADKRERGEDLLY
jgi:hypothetical protein